jgi:hypothetical protein
MLYKEKATIDGNRSWKALKPFNKTLQQEVLLSLAIHTDERSIQGSGIGQFTHKLAIQLKIMEAEGKAQDHIVTHGFQPKIHQPR